MKVQFFYQILSGLILTCVCSSGPDFIDGMQNDEDYQYSDEENISNGQIKTTEAVLTKDFTPFFNKSHVTVVAVTGKDAILECPVQNFSDHNVVLWLKGTTQLTTGTSVLIKEYYSLNATNFSLNVKNVTESNNGDYYCEILPQKIRMRTTLIIKDDPTEQITTKTSKSSENSVYVMPMLLTTSLIVTFLLSRI